MRPARRSFAGAQPQQAERRRRHQQNRWLLPASCDRLAARECIVAVRVVGAAVAAVVAVAVIEIGVVAVERTAARFARSFVWLPGAATAAVTTTRVQSAPETKTVKKKAPAGIDVRVASALGKVAGKAALAVAIGAEARHDGVALIDESAATTGDSVACAVATLRSAGGGGGCVDDGVVAVDKIVAAVRPSRQCLCGVKPSAVDK